MVNVSNRREWLALTGATVVSIAGASTVRAAEKKEPDEREVPAVEDLMREHGILRRALLVSAVARRRAMTAPAPPTGG